LDEFDHVFDTHAAVPDPADEVRSDALYRVVIPRQNLVVRLNGLWPDIPEDEFLPAVRPYRILRMAWAIWRELPTTRGYAHHNCTTTAWRFPAFGGGSSDVLGS
jgi:hypothetical protein